MNYPFNAQRGLIVIQAEIQGPSGSIVLRLALDTGATGTMINVAPLTTIDYDPSMAPDRIQVTTGSGVEYARLSVLRIKAMGQERENFPVLAHTFHRVRALTAFWGWIFCGGKRCGLISSAESSS